MVIDLLSFFIFFLLLLCSVLALWCFFMERTFFRDDPEGQRKTRIGRLVFLAIIDLEIVFLMALALTDEYYLVGLLLLIIFSSIFNFVIRIWLGLLNKEPSQPGKVPS